LAYEARLSVTVSADDNIKAPIESYLKRELRQIDGVILTSDKPKWHLSIVALPQKGYDGMVLGYWMSITVFQYTDYFNPQKPLFTQTKGRILKHELMLRGRQVLQDGLKQLAAELDTEIIEKDRQAYDSLRDWARKAREKKTN